jgi:hypothetical protein
MKRKIKLTEQDLYRIVKRVIRETEEKEKDGFYFTLGGKYFFVKNKKMFLAGKPKDSDEFSENLGFELPNSKELSVIWGKDTREVDDPETQGVDLQDLVFDTKMQNAMKIGNEIHSKETGTSRVGGGYKPIVYYSLTHDAPVLAGMIISTDFTEPSDGEMLRTIESPQVGDKIFYQKSTFKAEKKKQNKEGSNSTSSKGGKEYGISIEYLQRGQEFDPEELGIKKKKSLPERKLNIGAFFDENSAKPKNLERATFLDEIKEHIKNGGKINRITIEAATSKLPAGREDNSPTGRRWKELNEYDDVVMGNYDDGTGNLQLCKHKAINTYNTLKRAIPELANAPYILKAAGPVGEYVHIKFE